MTSMSVMQEPFRHVVCSDWVDRSLCRAAAATFPSPDWEHWHVYRGTHSVKRASKDRLRVPVAALAAIDRVAEFPISRIFGDTRAFPDLDLHAAGMHSIPPGGFLGWHLDAETHQCRPWVRRFSAVLFLTDDWQSDWGGQLVLGTQTCSDTVVIEPELGTLVVFETGDLSWHRVRDVSRHATTDRNTLALFWYSIQPETQKRLRDRAHFA